MKLRHSLALGVLLVLGACNQEPSSDKAPTNIQELPQNQVQNSNELENARQQISKAMQDSDKVRLMECIGVNPWKVKPDGWIAPTKNECTLLQQKMEGNEQKLNQTASPIPPKEVALLIANAEKLNDRCRGGLR